MAVKVWIVVCWVCTVQSGCSYQHFGEACCLHLQGECENEAAGLSEMWTPYRLHGGLTQITHQNCYMVLPCLLFLPFPILKWTHSKLNGVSQIWTTQLAYTVYCFTVIPHILEHHNLLLTVKYSYAGDVLLWCRSLMEKHCRFLRWSNFSWEWYD
jgi:hypothetical protein